MVRIFKYIIIQYYTRVYNIIIVRQPRSLDHNNNIMFEINELFDMT